MLIRIRGRFCIRLATVSTMLVLALFSVVARSGDLGARYSFGIEPQSMSSALLAFSELTDIQVSTSSADLTNLESPGVVGDWTASEALEKLVVGTDLTFRAVAQNTVAIERRRGHENSADGQGTRKAESSSDAEDTKGAPSDGEGTQNEWISEVVVTATKRAERVQDVPMSIAVIGAQEIERRGLVGQEDYLRSIPGVNEVNRGSWDNAIVIRGIASQLEQQTSPNSSGSTVASYFDETPITGAGGMGAGGVDVRPVDIERIEVLRGPQGTTFGSASLGGATRIIPVKPRLDRFGLKVAASYSGTSDQGGENSMLQGIVNIPLVDDQLAVRAVGYRYDESGFYRNVAGVDPTTIALAESYGLGDYVRGYVKDDIGRMRSTGGRLAALWQATDKLNLSLNFLRQSIEQDGYPAADTGGYEQLRFPVAVQQRARGETGETGDLDMDVVNLVLNYDLGWAALTSAASWVDSSSYATFSILPPPFLYSLAYPSEFNTFTAETRLASQLEGRLRFLGGVYYENLDETNNTFGYWPGSLANNPYSDTDLEIVRFDVRRRNDQYAVFGEVSYALTEKLTATVGGRFFKYEKDQFTQREGDLFGVPLGTTVAPLLKSSDDGSTFKADITYRPTQDSMIYAAWSEGFRLGRPVLGLPAATCDADGDGLVDGTGLSIDSTRTIASDFLENYEIGSKFALLDRKLLFDASVYHIQWNDLPLRAIAPAPCGQPYFSNVGAATSDGVELQASFFPIRGLRFDVGGGYLDAKLAKDAPGLLPPAFDGDRLPGSPKWSANFAGQYDFNIVGRKAFVRADSLYVGTLYGDLLESPLTAAGDYVKVDMRAGVTLSNLSLEIFVRNVTNEDAFTWRGQTNASSFFGYRMRPRTIGIQLGYTFE